MEKIGDWLIMFIAAGIMLWWVVRRFDRWLHEPPDERLRKLALDGPVPMDDEAASFIESHGYEVLSGKHRVTFGVSVDEGPAQSTRLYFDYLARKDNLYYLVKLERARQPIEWTASGLRERLLVYQLLFPDCEALIVADPQNNQLRTVKFKVGDDDR